MPTLPEKSQQVVQAHAGLIHRVVIACQNRAAVPDLEDILKQANDNGWSNLVAAIRKILAGKRDIGAFRHLDEEDFTIIESILMGLQNPATLPDLSEGFDANMAAPGLAYDDSRRTQRQSRSTATDRHHGHADATSRRRYGTTGRHRPSAGHG